MEEVQRTYITKDYLNKLTSEGKSLFIVISGLIHKVEKVEDSFYYSQYDDYDPRFDRYVPAKIKHKCSVLFYKNKEGKQLKKIVKPLDRILSNYNKYKLYSSNKTFDELYNVVDFLDTKLEIGDMVFGYEESVERTSINNVIGTIVEIKYKQIRIKTIKKGSRITSKSFIDISPNKVLKVTDRNTLSRILMLKMKS